MQLYICSTVTLYRSVCECNCSGPRWYDHQNCVNYVCHFLFVDDSEMMIGQDVIWIKFVHQLNESNIIIHI